MIWFFLDYMHFQFGFNDKLRGWIHARVFLGILVVLVNGCLTQEVSIQKGLKQCDSLSPFLFILVVEGLNWLFSKSAYQQIFSYFRVDS